MKNTVIIIVLLFISKILFGQGTKPNEFYASYEDYKSGKAIPGVTLTHGVGSMVLGLRKVGIEQDGVRKKVKLSELPGPFFTDNGVLVRLYKNNIYYVLIDGPMCFYMDCFESDFHTSGDTVNFEDFYMQHQVARNIVPYPTEYYSMTIRGDIEKLKEGDFKKMLETKNLKQNFEKDKPKREFKDTVDGYLCKLTRRTVKYVRLYNQ